MMVPTPKRLGMGQDPRCLGNWVWDPNLDIGFGPGETGVPGYAGGGCVPPGGGTQSPELSAADQAIVGASHGFTLVNGVLVPPSAALQAQAQAILTSTKLYAPAPVSPPVAPPVAPSNLIKKGVTTQPPSISSPVPSITEHGGSMIPGVTAPTSAQVLVSQALDQNAAAADGASWLSGQTAIAGYEVSNILLVAAAAGGAYLLFRGKR